MFVYIYNSTFDLSASPPPPLSGTKKETSARVGLHKHSAKIFKEIQLEPVSKTK